MKTNWLCKTNKRKLSGALLVLLLKRGVICRSLHRTDGVLIANVAQIKPGDVIHVYHDHKPVGAYEVLRPASRVGTTALDRITDERVQHLISTAKGDGLSPDPRTGELTGWRVRRVGSAMPVNFNDTNPRNQLHRLAA